jgi:hypothetical protein
MKFIKKYKFVFLIFLFWRLGLFLTGLISFNLLPFRASFPYVFESLISTGLPQYIWHWANFDGVHYLVISQFGYDGMINNEQVFFPLYPLLIKLFGGGLITALLISNIFALFSGLTIYKYFGRWPAIFFYAFPTAFFLGSVYTESLFIFLVLLTFYKNKLFGFLAGLTRLFGGFTGIIGALGVFGYMVYLKLIFDNPLLFLFNQGGFNNNRASSLAELITPPQTVFRYLKIFFTADPANIAFWVSLLEISSFIFAAGVLIYLTYKRKFNLWILVYCWAVIIVPSLTGTLTSLPRYILVLFPVYVFLGGLNLKLKLFLTVIFAILQALLAALFLRGYFIA